MLYTRTFYPENLIHPWITLGETLEAMGIAQKELAIRADISEKQISGIINGANGITPETALKLERVLWIPASFWNNLEKAYQEDKVRIEEQELMVNEKELVKEYPYNDLCKLGYLPETRITSERLINLLNFFGVTSLTSLLKLMSLNIAFWETKVAFRKSEKYECKPEVLASWLRCWEIEIKNDFVWEFNKTKLKEILDELKALTTEDIIDLAKIKELLNSAGVLFAFVPCLPNLHVSGITKKHNGNPFIQISDRLKKHDIFWFSFFHEVAHVLLHLHKKDDVFLNIEDKEEEKEKEANEWAGDFLINPDNYKNFIRTSRVNEDTIQQFAKSNWVWRSIVAWRLWHDFTESWVWGILSSLRIRLEIKS